MFALAALDNGAAIKKTDFHLGEPVIALKASLGLRSRAASC
jgi:hypothetical protein